MFQQNQIRKYCEYHFSISSVAAYLRKSPSIASEARLLLDHAQIGAHRERIVVTELEVWHVRMARCDAALKPLRPTAWQVAQNSATSVCPRLTGSCACAEPLAASVAISEKIGGRNFIAIFHQRVARRSEQNCEHVCIEIAFDSETKPASQSVFGK